MRWNKGFTAEYHAAIVNPVTWRDRDLFEITGGSVKTSDSSLREAADIQCPSFDHTKEYWTRIYLTASQNDDVERVALFTGLTSVPDRSFNGLIKKNTIQCYSVLKPADDVLMPLGWYILAGSNGAKAVRDLLKEVIPAPITIEGESPYLNSTLYAESGETVLSMADYILNVIGWRIRITGMGEVVICPQASEISAYFDVDKNDVFEMDVSISDDWYAIPNVLRVLTEDMMAIAKDEDPDSPYSIPTRGREIWVEESATLSTDETIGEYARRRLSELQESAQKISYTRRFDPNVKATDRIWVNYPDQDIKGEYYITSQTIELGFGAKTSEEAEGTI